MGRYMQSRYFNIGAGEAAAAAPEEAPQEAAATAGEAESIGADESPEEDAGTSP